MVVCLMCLSVYRLVVSISVAYRVHVVRVHGLVIVRKLVWCLFTGHVVGCSDAVVIVTSMMTV